jgi:iron complex transport system substrate-binding protein
MKNSRVRLYSFIILLLAAASASVIFSCRAKRAAQSTAADRIITISPNITEIAYALGLGERIIAVSSDSDWPAQAKEKIQVGSFWQPNIEAIIAAKPDLVITEKFEQQKTVADNLARLRISVLTLQVDTIDQMREAILQIGIAARCRQEAERLVADMDNQINNIRSKFAETKKTKTLWVVQPEPLRVASRNTFINELIEIAGGENCLGQTIQQYPQIGEEELLTCPAEVIIQSAMGKTDIAEQQKEAEKIWGQQTNLPAVKMGRIYVVNSDLVLRLGPRLPQGIETIGRLLHPEQPGENDRNENKEQNGSTAIND